MKIPAAQKLLSRSIGQEQQVRMVFNAVLLLVWAWLYHPVYSYLGTIFTRQEFRINQFLLLAVIVLIVLQFRKGNYKPRFGVLPQLYAPALLFALGGSIFFLIVERFLDINTLSASLFGLATYGLLGLWLRPRLWRQGIPAALLLIGALPFGEHMQTFVGYPVRILTATIIRDGLSVLGIHSVGVDTILVFESGISKIDLPCSGVKSLWTGGLFLLAATWIERRHINFRWLLATLIFAILLLVANLARVAILVIVGEVAGWRLIAEMLHVPLGVLGFVGACAAAVAMLRWSGPSDAQEDSGTANAKFEIVHPTWLAPVLSGIVLLLALLYVPRPQDVLAKTPPTWQFPAELSTQPWPLTEGELKWLSGDGAVSANRWRFQWRGTTGSMLFVTSATWRAQHRPERCFQVYGLTIENSYTSLIARDFAVRLVSLGGRDQQELMSAAYWFQNGEQATDDFATRMWADLSPQRQRWVLVTVLFDTAVDPNGADVQALYTTLRGSLQRSLEGGAQP
jgi:exosortase O